MKAQVSITSKLKEFREGRQQEGEALLNESQKLLADVSAEENRVLKEIGLGKHLKQAEDKVEEALLHKEFTTRYEGEIFHYNDLRKIGLKYRLFMKVASEYRGKIPPDLGAIVLRLAKKHNLNINDSYNSDKGRFFIMAPPAMFDDYASPWDKFKKYIGDIENSIKEFFAEQQDPVIFYKVGKDHYMLLKQWGGDFGPFRRALGLLTETKAFGILATVFLLYQYVRLWIGTYKYFEETVGLWVKGSSDTADFFAGLLLFLMAAFGIILVVQAFRFVFHDRLWSLSYFTSRFHWNYDRDTIRRTQRH